MSYLDEVLADAPRAYYRLNEPAGSTIADDLGSANNDGTYAGAPTFERPSPIIADPTARMVLFTPADSEYMATDDDAAYDVGDVFTLEAWIDGVTGAPGADGWAIISMGPNAGYMRVSTAGGIELLCSNVAVLGSSTFPVNDGKPHHIVWTKNGATSKLWIDAVDRTPTITDTTMSNTGFGFTVGADRSFADVKVEFFNGKIGEAALYATALPQARVAAHFRAATSGLGACPDFARTNIFPFAPAEEFIWLGRGRPGRLGAAGLMRGTGPHPAGGFEGAALHPRLHPVYDLSAGFTIFDAVVAGQADVAADMVRGRDLAAPVVGQAAVSADVVVIRSLVAAPSGQAAVTVADVVTRSLAATVSGQATVTVDLQIIGAAIVFNAVVAGQASVAVALSVTRALAAAAAGQGAVVAQQSVTRSVAATVAGQGAVVAQADRIRNVAATVAGQGAVTAAVLRIRQLNATVTPAGAALTAALSRFIGLEASPAGQGTITVTLSRLALMNALVQGLAQVSAAFPEDRLLDGVVCDDIILTRGGEVVNSGELKVGTFKVGSLNLHCPVIDLTADDAAVVLAGSRDVIDIGEHLIGEFVIGDYDPTCDSLVLTPEATDTLVLVSADPEDG